MPTDWTQELFGGSTGAVTPAQAPPQTDWTSELFGGGTQPPPAQSPPEPPDNRSLLQKGVDLVRGRQDPAYQGLKSFDEEMGAEKNTDAIRKLRMGAMVAGDDARYGDIMKDSLGDRFVRKETDKFGHDVVVYKGADGAEKKAYVNKPGLDTEDVSRGMVGAVPYLATMGPVGGALRGAGLLARMSAQALTGAGTSAATDVAAMGLGSEQGIDKGRAAVAGVVGAGGEAAAPIIGALWRKFVTVPGLYDRATGQLTDKGIRAAKAAGIDPDAISGKIGEEFAKAYAKTGSAAEAGNRAVNGATGIPSTVGQRAKDPQQLMIEKAMRSGVYGEQAKTVMQEFDKRQAQAVQDAAVGGYSPIPGAAIPATEVKPGIAASLAPRRSLNALDPASFGQDIRTGLTSAKDVARSTEREAWEGATDLLPKPEAFEILPDALSGRIGSLRMDEKITPKAMSMAEDLQKWVDGKAVTEGAPAILKQTPVRTVDEMRRRLLSTYKNTVDPQDKAASKAIYDGYNDWIAQAAEKELLLGKPEAAAALRTARGVTREIKDLFAPTGPTGQKTAGARILEEVMEKADSPERIVSSLFFNTPQPSTVKAGSLEALQRMKAILEKFHEPEVSQHAWNDIRAAYWMRLVQDKKGDIFTPGVMLGNIKNAIQSQKSVVQTLYSPDELKRIGLLVRNLEQITYKDPNPSGTATGVAVLTRQLFDTFLKAVGAKSVLARTALEYSGVGKAYGAATAKKAVSDAMTTKQPLLSPTVTAGSSNAYDQN